MVSPFNERTEAFGMSFGLGPAGYDLRCNEDITLLPGRFSLASAIEALVMPNHVVAVVHDKSTWARLGLSLFNTIIDPGFQGSLTLEMTNHSRDALHIKHGMPICHLVFSALDEATEMPYNGKYNNQEPGPQPARFSGTL